MIYLDSASTTKPSPAVVEVVTKSMEEKYFNPSSMHSKGHMVEGVLKDIKEKFADYLNVLPDEIIFTSGGTESNNLAILGAAKAQKKKNHIITVKTEHPSVQCSVASLKKQGYKVDYLDTDKWGYVDKTKLKELISEETVLVSIMDVNNEIGVVQDITEIGRIIKKANPEVIFHVDGIQSFGKRRISLKHVDMFSFSSHKIHGPKGAGALYVRNGVKMHPLVFGGEQQKKLRPGTENTFGIFGFAKATEEAYTNMEQRQDHVQTLRDRLLVITKVLPDVVVNSDIVNGSPYILNISFLGVKGEVLLHSLSQDGIYVATGAACSKKTISSVLKSLGAAKEIHESAIRFSFCYENTAEDIDKTIEVVKKHVEFLRKYVRK